MKVRALKGVVAIGLALTANGCVGAGLGVGLIARSAQSFFGEKSKSPDDRIATAQERAISEAHGGGPGIPIAWSDAQAGINGALLEDAGADLAKGCRRYQQTIILTGETLQGSVEACEQKDGKWKLAGIQSKP